MCTDVFRMIKLLRLIEYKLRIPHIELFSIAAPILGKKKLQITDRKLTKSLK